jgi:hypothetical protein
MSKLNRIGNKLGLAGAIGILLAAGMVANQIATESTVTAANYRADRSQRIVESMSAAHLNMRQAQLAGRAIRLARTPAEVQKGTAELHHFEAIEARELDTALATAQNERKTAENQGADAGLRRRHEGTREGAGRSARADRQAVGDLY